MAFKTVAQLAGEWINGFIPFAVHYQDVWDSHEKAPRRAVLDAGGETSMEVRYNGDNTPTLTKEANGEYRLELGANTGRVSFVWRESGGTLTGSNTLKLKIRDADGGYLHCLAKVFAEATGDEYTPQLGVTHKCTQPLAGDTVLELANMSNVPGDWRVVGVIS